MCEFADSLEIRLGGKVSKHRLYHIELICLTNIHESCKSSLVLSSSIGEDYLHLKCPSFLYYLFINLLLFLLWCWLLNLGLCTLLANTLPLSYIPSPIWDRVSLNCQSGLILLPHPLKGWDYRCVPSCQGFPSVESFLSGLWISHKLWPKKPHPMVGQME
jgi:hypothetical protein